MIKSTTLVLAVVLCSAAVGLSACGSGSSSTSSGGGSAAAGATTSAASSSISLPTTKFLLHAGLAFGAFHHWIYRPIKAGALRHPFSNKLTLIKAGLAALFVSHELRIAVADAKASKVLRPVVAPLTAAADKLAALKSSITGGSVNPTDLDGINTQLGRAGQTAQSAGQAIKEKLPSASQLAAGAG